MPSKDINKEYFRWLCFDIDSTPNNDFKGYKKLLYFLFKKEFRWSNDIPMDANRSSDGLVLRDEFMSYYDENEILIMPRRSSVLEMMVALSKRCENIMHDKFSGDRTSFWFWEMVHSMGLDEVGSDENYISYEVNKIVENFLDRNYNYDGRGGLFTIPFSENDMRDVEIWCQMSWYQDYYI